MKTKLATLLTVILLLMLAPQGVAQDEVVSSILAQRADASCL